MDLATMDVEIPAADTGDAPVDDIDTSVDATSTDDSAGDAGEADGTNDTPVEGEEKPDKAAKPLDGRSIPAKYRELFKTDKDLRAMYFQAAEFKKHFESPAKAAETLEQLSALGGFEGIQATQAEFAEIDRMFASGDKALLDKFLSQPANKEGFAKLGPALFDEYRKADEAAWTHDVAKVMASTLAQSGVGTDLTTLAALVKDNPEAAAVVKKIAALVSGIDTLAAAPVKPKVDPEREKLMKDRAEFERSKSELFLQEVNNVIGVHIEKGIRESLTPYLKGRKLDPESYSLIEANVGGELSKLMNADPTFKAQKDAVMKSGDKTRIQNFFQSRITKHLPDAAKRVMRAFGSVGTPVAPKPASVGTPPPTGVIKLSSPPKAEDIDYRKSGNMIMDGQAWLKNGKRVQW